MTDLERIKKDVVEMDSRANVCWYDTKVLTKAVRLILEELTADRKTEPQTDCNGCIYLHCNGECGEVEDEPQYETGMGTLKCDNCSEYGSFKCTKCDGEMYFKRLEPKDEPQERSE